jgi:hypothetical protein
MVMTMLGKMAGKNGLLVRGVTFGKDAMVKLLVSACPMCEIGKDSQRLLDLPG